MRKESITYLDTENGQASRISSKEKLPISDKRLEIIFKGITKIVFIILSFWLAGKVITETDTSEKMALALLALFIMYFIFFIKLIKED